MLARDTMSRVVDRATCVVEEDIDPFGTRFLNRRGKVGRFLVIYSRVEADLAAPPKLCFPPPPDRDPPRILRGLPAAILQRRSRH